MNTTNITVDDKLSSPSTASTDSTGYAKNNTADKIENKQDKELETIANYNPILKKNKNSSLLSESSEWKDSSEYNLTEFENIEEFSKTTNSFIENGEDESVSNNNVTGLIYTTIAENLNENPEFKLENVTEFPNTSWNLSQTTLKRVNFNKYTISQTASMNITELFDCKIIKQKIISSRICDGILDCADGTDEQNCNCSSKLKILAPEKICDSFIDCADHSDEQTCSDYCGSEQFFCGRSRECIDIQYRCDGEQNCLLNEDEINCIALVNETHHIKIDQGGRPMLLPEGLVFSLKNGQWQPICLKENELPLEKALKTCHYLGFSEAKNYKEITIKNFAIISPSNSLNETPNIFNNNENNNNIKNFINESCQGLFVECSLTNSKSRPWLTKVYVEGKLNSIGILLTDRWVAVTSSTSLLNTMSGKMYVSVSVGIRNSSSSIVGPYEQNIPIDNITFVHSPLVLLHLKKAAVLNHLVIPMGIHVRSPSEEVCEGITLNSRGKITYIPLEKEVNNCKKGKRCFKVVSMPEYCMENDISGVSGHVVCYSNYGAYLASIFNQEDAFCQVDCFVTLKDVLLIEENLIKLTKVKEVNTFEEPVCNTLRCFHGNCLDWRDVYDGTQQCPDGNDESEIMKIEKENYCIKHKNCTCGPNKFKCNSGECLNLAKYCDGTNDCFDKSDEKENCHESCILFLNATNPEYICDGNQNCYQKDDETWELCHGKYNCTDQANFFQCEKSEVCIPKSFVCDNNVDCPQKEDEVACWSLDYSNDKETQGRLVARSYGIWYVPCFVSQMDHNLHLEICNLLGYKSVKNATYEMINKTVVTLDPFSRVALSPNLQFIIRSNQPNAKLIQNGTCQSLYIECQ